MIYNAKIIMGIRLNRDCDTLKDNNICTASLVYSYTNDKQSNTTLFIN